MLEKSEWKGKFKVEGKKNNRANWLTPTETPGRTLKTLQQSYHHHLYDRAKNPPTRAESQTHKPQLTFNLRSAELQS